MDRDAEEYLYPSAEDALVVNCDVLGVQPDDASVYLHDLNLLESALARPRNAASHEGADLIRQAATLLYGLVKNHPFHDGNKRTAYILTKAFLAVNETRLPPSTDDAFNMLIGVATGSLGQSAIESWLRDHVG